WGKVDIPMSAIPPKADINGRIFDVCFVPKQKLVSPKWSERRNRDDDFLCSHNGTGVVRHVDVERGVHHLVRVIRRRVLDHGDLIAEFGGVANGRFNAGMRDQPDDDDLMDTVLLKLQIKVSVGEATRAPML